MASTYAIGSLPEAEADLQHPVLGPRARRRTSRCSRKCSSKTSTASATRPRSGGSDRIHPCPRFSTGTPSEVTVAS
ncbi:MAG: hypothetical protein H0V22_01325 [Solirubrobacterales bacterium]|nr:hypothetical protein [Solirubrobacterales bacterium]